MKNFVKHPITEKKVLYYNCKDCGMVLPDNPSMRPNMKFCSASCMSYVKVHRLAKGRGNTWYMEA